MSFVAASGAVPGAAIEKARLIGEALDILRVAKEIDERESLDRESWVAWYDATIPQVRDLKILVGAMEIETLRRSGEAPRKPGPKTGVELLLHRNSNSDQQQRSRARVLGAQPERVAAYIQHEAAAGRVPSVRGAVRAVKAIVSSTDRKTSRFRSGVGYRLPDVRDGLGDGTLDVEFAHGGVYRYFQVPTAVWAALVASPSIGKAFATLIRGRFAFVPLPPAVPIDGEAQAG